MQSDRIDTWQREARPDGLPELNHQRAAANATDYLRRYTGFWPEGTVFGRKPTEADEGKGIVHNPLDQEDMWKSVYKVFWGGGETETLWWIEMLRQLEEKSQKEATKTKEVVSAERDVPAK